MYANLTKKCKKFPKEFDFLPKTYCLKYDYDEFMRNKKKCKYWIIKPVDSARGKGIRVVSCDEKIKYNKGKYSYKPVTKFNFFQACS